MAAMSRLYFYGDQGWGEVIYSIAPDDSYCLYGPSDPWRHSPHFWKDTWYKDTRPITLLELALLGIPSPP